MRAALLEAPKADPALFAAIDSASAVLAAIERRLSGDPARGRLNEPDTPSISGRVGSVAAGHWETRQMPTATQRRDLELASTQLAGLQQELRAIVTGEIARLEAALEAAGAPYSRPPGD
jgi:hypothetical protein